MMRIISGRARGTKLNTPEGNSTRPTMERAKEAIFSSIQFEISDREVLDLFAGSGQMGLEALSRGAKHATFVDKNAAAARVVGQNIKKTHFEEQSTLLNVDALEFLRKNKNARKFNLVFLDPPYGSIKICELLHSLVSFATISDGALVVVESSDDDIFGDKNEMADLFDVVKSAKYGIACVSILKYKEKIA